MAIEVPFDEKMNEKLMKERQEWQMENNLPTEPLDLETDEPKPLKMEHFYFPLGLWLAGLLLSALSLLAEIIIHHVGGPSQH